MKRVEWLAATLLIFAAGCSDASSSKPDIAPSALDEASGAPSLESAVEIDEVALPEFSVIDRSASPPHKLAIDVRLPGKISEQEIAAIASHLKSREASSFDRIFILYYLPDMTVGAGAWASSHFDPDLEIRVLGLSAEEESKASAVADDVPDKVGVWLDDRPYVGATNVMYEADGTIRLKTTYKDGSGSDIALVESADKRGRKFVDQYGNEFGEYYILDSAGDLSVFDNDGLILRMKKKS